MDYWLHIGVVICIYVLLTASLNLVVGYLGLPVLSHGAFFCVGAYTSALLAMDIHVSPWVGLAGAGLVSASIAVVIATACLRLSGDYLSLATIGFSVVVHALAKNWIQLTRGPLGLPNIPRLSVGGWEPSYVWQQGLLVAVVVLAFFFIMARLVESPYGRVMVAIREDETGAEMLGWNVRRIKMSVFVFSAFVAGIAGSLYAHYMTFIDPSSFNVLESIVLMLMVVFGGMGSLLGSAIGTALLVAFPEVLRLIGVPMSVAAPLRQMAYGVMLVGLMVWRPQGLTGRYRWR